MTVLILNFLNFMCNWLKKLFGGKGACGHCDHCGGHCEDKKPVETAQPVESKPLVETENIEKK